MTHWSVSLLAPTRQEQHLRCGGSGELVVKGVWCPAYYNKEAPRWKTGVLPPRRISTGVSGGAGLVLQHLQVVLRQKATPVTGPPVGCGLLPTLTPLFTVEPSQTAVGLFLKGTLALLPMWMSCRSTVRARIYLCSSMQRKIQIIRHKRINTPISLQPSLARAPHFHWLILQ